jgi:hypothetical protein
VVRFITLIDILTYSSQVKCPLADFVAVSHPDQASLAQTVSFRHRAEKERAMLVCFKLVPLEMCAPILRHACREDTSIV